MARHRAEAQYVLTLTAPGQQRHRAPDGNWCECTPEGGVHLGEWNATLGRRWSRFMDALRYHFGQVEFFKGAEPQKRGALHLHVPLVFVGRRRRVTLAELRRLAVAHGFGHSVALDRIEPGSKRAVSAARYVAKYVTKSATEQPEIPWVDLRTGELGPGRWRTWSASRGWGTTMLDVRQAQRAWVRVGTGVPSTPAQPEGEGATGPLDPNTVRSGIEGVEPLPRAVLVAM